MPELIYAHHLWLCMQWMPEEDVRSLGAGGLLLGIYSTVRSGNGTWVIKLVRQILLQAEPFL